MSFLFGAPYDEVQKRWYVGFEQQLPLANDPVRTTGKKPVVRKLSPEEKKARKEAEGAAEPNGAVPLSEEEAFTNEDEQVFKRLKVSNSTAVKDNGSQYLDPVTEPAWPMGAFAIRDDRERIDKKTQKMLFRFKDLNRRNIKERALADSATRFKETPYAKKKKPAPQSAPPAADALDFAI